METTNTPTVGAPTTPRRREFADILADAMRKGGTLTDENGQVNIEATAVETLNNISAVADNFCALGHGGITALLTVVNEFALNAAATQKQDLARNSHQALTELLEIYHAALVMQEELRGLSRAAEAYEEEVFGPYEN